MKKTLLLAAFLVSAVILKAQPTADEIGLLQSAYGMEKRAIVEQFMKLTEVEATAFWKVYEEYELSRKELGQKRLSTIVDYANNYATLSDDKASELIKRALGTQMDIAKLQQKTFGKMAKAITARRAAQFIQLENYLETVIRLNIADDIPMIGELDDKRKN